MEHLRPAVAIGLLCAGWLAADPARAPAQADPAADPAAEPPDPARIELDEPVQAPDSPQTRWERWKAFKEGVEDEHGLSVGLNLDFVYRNALSGPETGNSDLVSRYDLLLRQRFTDNARASLAVRGGWGDGFDETIGSFANTDQFARTDQDVFVLHLYYEQDLLEDQLTLRVGKFDVGDWVDTNRYGFYNFLSYGFAHNTTIPLTGNTLGVMATYQPKEAEWIYVTAGTSNASQTPSEVGLSSLVDDPDLFSIVEVGLKPEFGGREGVYRFIGWHHGGGFNTAAGTVDSSATGFAVSFDQDLSDQLGLFFRFGTADGDSVEPKRYWQGGFLVKEPIPGRVNDSFAAGVVVNEFGDDRMATVLDGTDAETFLEAYYNVHLTEWAQLQPVLQVIHDPGGTDRDTAVILGLHLALRF
ncbi:MAG: carbohydrate porin [Phycisphaerae bacterium]